MDLFSPLFFTHLLIHLIIYTVDLVPIRPQSFPRHLIVCLGRRLVLVQLLLLQERVVPWLHAARSLPLKHVSTAAHFIVFRNQLLLLLEVVYTWIELHLLGHAVGIRQWLLLLRGPTAASGSVACGVGGIGQKLIRIERVWEEILRGLVGVSTDSHGLRVIREMVRSGRLIVVAVMQRLLRCILIDLLRIGLLRLRILIILLLLRLQTLLWRLLLRLLRVMDCRCACVLQLG